MTTAHLLEILRECGAILAVIGTFVAVCWLLDKL